MLLASPIDTQMPLVDAKLFETLGRYLSMFSVGVSKTMLAKLLSNPLPNSIINRRKTGISLRLSAVHRHQRHSPSLPLLGAPGTPWARRWARTVVDTMTACA